MRKRLLALLGAGLLLFAMSGTALAAGYGNCTTEEVNQAGHVLPYSGTLDGPVQGAQASYDATIAGNLCSNPGLALDNGWKFGTFMRDVPGVGFLFIGITRCDDNTLAPYCDWQNRTTPHYMFYGTQCSFPNTDEAVDLGVADWGQHQYRIWFDVNTQKWNLYIDNVVKVIKNAGAGGAYWCMNPTHSEPVIAMWLAQRYDRGDGWGDGGANFMTVRGMQIRTNSGWSQVAGTTGSGCAENTRPPGNTHYQTCTYDTYAGMKLNTVY